MELRCLPARVNLFDKESSNQILTATARNQSNALAK